MDPMQIKKKNDQNHGIAENNETHIIEQAIQKISELLILGFGQAGCKIITQFLYDPNKDFDQMIPG